MVVTRADKRMEVTVYGVFANMRDVPAIPIILPGLPPTSFKPPSSMYLDDPTFESFRTNIITGIGKFWSRDDMSLGADTWRSRRPARPARRTRSPPSSAGPSPLQ